MNRAEALAAYKVADKAYKASFKKFAAKQMLYRLEEISDKEYCDAYAAHKLVVAAFDEADFALRDSPEPEPVAEVSNQAELF